MQKNGVQCLLMGGQACVLYGGAEFSRDTDLAVLADPENLERLRRALDDLQATCITVPPFELRYLERGLAIHFRCRHPQAESLRIDVMSKMRGVDEFPALWDRRTTVELMGEPVELLSLPDLVQSKKTQRDKDWPMIARLLEANYFANRDDPSPEQVAFWLRELRTPSLLIEVAGSFDDECELASAERPLLLPAAAARDAELADALDAEERAVRAADAAYWGPLKEELAALRRDRRS